MRNTGYNQPSTLAAILAVAGSACGAAAQTVPAPPPVGPATSMIVPIAILLHNEQGSFFAAPIWQGANRGCALPDRLFSRVGDLLGGMTFSMVTGISADGSIVVGQSIGFAPGGTSTTQGFVFQPCLGIHVLARADDPAFSSIAAGVSRDGSVIVGSAGTVDGQGARWLDTGPLDLFIPTVSESPVHTMTTGVTPDGLIVIGTAMTGDAAEGFIFRQGDTIATALGDLAGGAFWSHAAAISADGQTIVGASDGGSGTVAFRWHNAYGMLALGDFGGGANESQAMAVSANGAVIAGWGTSVSGREAFRWTSTGGMAALGDLPGGLVESRAIAISADGATVVGAGATSRGSEAFVWDSQHGMRNLRDVLVGSYGFSLAGWTLTEATAISADGRVIAGNGINPAGQFEGWMVRIPGRCEADLDADGAVNSSDFFVFLTAFFGEGMDFNGDGIGDSQDFFAFLAAFFSGCD